MPKTSLDYSSQIIDQLKILIPDLSLDPLTPERKIVDTVAEILAESSIDPYILNYQYDIDTKVGSDLDKFVALFGFARQAGRRATGTVTFSRAQAANDDILIPSGTIVQVPPSAVSGTTSFVTTASVILVRDATSISAPIEAAAEGIQGNVPALTITQIGGLGATSVSGVLNTEATTGGTERESDAELKVRFKNTIFRNIAGTRDQYLALAIATRFAQKANVIGPISRFIEYVQIEPDLIINSIIPYSKYTYNFDYYVTSGDSSNEIFYGPNGADYTFGASVPPTITVNNTTNLPVGSVVLFEHAYCSTNSRNDPLNNVTNYIDVYTNGQDAVEASESLLFPSSSNNFVNVTSPYDIHNFVRADTGARPTVGNVFQELVWQPIVTIPDVITINGTDYFKNTHFWPVKDVTNYKNSKRARDGIEWASSVAISVPQGTPFLLLYTFNKLPLVLNEIMDRHKQVTSDVLVHSATDRLFNINLIVMYTAGFSRASVDIALQNTLTAFFERQQFGSLIQISDLLEVAHEVPGVDNIRLATPSDGVAYGVQEIAPDGSIIGVPYVNDFALQDSDLPVLNSVVTIQKSQNTW